MGTGLANRRTVSDPQKKEPGFPGFFFCVPAKAGTHFQAFSFTLPAVNVRAAPIQAAFANCGDAMDLVLEMVDKVAEAYGLPDEVLTNLRIALDEVVTNIMNYAYVDGGRHEFTIRCELRGEALETVIEDDGVAYDPLSTPVPDLTVSFDQRKVGGLGVHFVKNLMSAVTYERIGNRNRLTLKQELKKDRGNA